MIEVFELLAKDECHWTRASLAENPNTPSHIIKMLSQDKNIFVKKAVACRSDLSREVFDCLYLDKAYEIQVELARNPTTPSDILEEIYRNKEAWYAHKYVMCNPNVSTEILKEVFEKRKISKNLDIASNPNTPVNILVAISQSESNEAKAAVAKNPNLPRKELEKLAKHSCFSVRMSAASNPSLISA